VTAVDSSNNRLARLKENLQRTRLEAELIEADALTWNPARKFDAILLDAPCSATGTFRRHPEVLYRARPPIIEASVDVQTRLLDRTSEWLKPGGTLVYSVCSLEPEEGERIVAAFLGRHMDFRIDAPKRRQLPAFVPASAHGWVRILPGLLEVEGGLDAFFMARLVRGG
jgi:16S rRNA (cytosine967-C5)-methyltransferase